MDRLGRVDDGRRICDDVAIRRDAFGVPHSHGRTDAAAAYGYAYAQAEDNFWQIEENFLRASGQASLLIGSEALLDDWLNGSLRVPELAQEEYGGAQADLKAILEAYAAGVNDWASHTRTAFRGLHRVEPWHPLALIRYLYYQRGFLGATRLKAGEYRAAFERLNPGVSLTARPTPSPDSWLALADPDEVWPRREPGQGSNSWAVRPKGSRPLPLDQRRVDAPLYRRSAKVLLPAPTESVDLVDRGPRGRRAGA